MQVYSKTDKGPVRHSNQDAFVTGTLADGAVYAAVCDGMGGANAGNIASETAARSISEYVRNSYREGMDSVDIEKILKNAIISANIEIYDLSLKRQDLSGMGTTVVATVVKGNTAVIAHVGDSRAYIAAEELTQITRDHSVVQGLIESGKITAEDAKVHPRKNVITRALGVEENIIADTASVYLEKAAVLMLCTDGLTGYAEEKEILKVIKSVSNANIPSALVELAIKGGGGDNVTVAAIIHESDN